MSGQTVTVGAINQVARTTMIWEKKPRRWDRKLSLYCRPAGHRDKTTRTSTPLCIYIYIYVYIYIYPLITGTAPPRSDTVFAEHSPYFLSCRHGRHLFSTRLNGLSAVMFKQFDAPLCWLMLAMRTAGP